MKKILALVLGAVIFGGAAMASASANDWYINLSDGGTGTTTVSAPYNSDHTRFLTMYGATGQPRFYSVDDTYLTFDDTNDQLHVNDFPIAKITDLQSTLDSKAAASAVTTLSGVQTVDEDHITNLTTFKNFFASSTPITYYVNSATTTPMKRLLFNGTTTSGVTTFYLTNDGTSSGTALCPITIGHVNVIANDPNNTFGLGWAITNSNKTLTITANARSFTTTTILGISVLGSNTLAAAANGTAIMASVDCN